MTNPYPANIQDGAGNVRIAGAVDFTDPDNQPGGPGATPTLESVLTEGNNGGLLGLANTGTIATGGGGIDTENGIIEALGVLASDGTSSTDISPGEVSLESDAGGVQLLATSALRVVTISAPIAGVGIRVLPKIAGGGNLPDGAIDLAAGVPLLKTSNRPEVPASPTAQDIVDALLTLGIVTQAS